MGSFQKRMKIFRIKMQARMAAFAGNVDLVKLLVTRTRAIDSSLRESGASALFLAAQEPCSS